LIDFLIQPKLRKVLVLDSADWDKKRYKEFTGILNMLATFPKEEFILEENRRKLPVP